MDFLEIKGYKSIKELQLDLRPINILIGANGSGKSNFISFFEFLNRLYERKLEEYVALMGGAEKFLHKGNKTTTLISNKISFNEDINAYSFTISKGEEPFVFLKEDLWFQGDPFDISDYGNEANVKIHKSFRADYIREYLKGLKKYHFHETGKNSPFNQVSHIENDSYFLYERGDNLAAFLFNIQKDHQIVYNRIINTIQSIAPFFSDFYFQPNSEGYIRLQWQNKYSQTVYGASDLSDGSIRFIALTTLFLQPNLPSSIIIDEPELGLHPFAIAKLAGMIQSVASRGTQVIIATQSSDLVNHFQAEDILTVDQKNGESSFKRLQADDLSVWLDEYSIGDLWQRNIIHGGQPGR